MTKLAIGIDLHRCIGCNTCALACKMQNNVPDGMLWNRVLTENCELFDGAEGTYPHLTRTYVPLACQHCSNAACQRVCPTGATYTDEKGRVQIDYQKCIGCRMCMAACPYNARVFNWNDPVRSTGANWGDGRVPTREKGMMEKCTLCKERTDAGDEPMCVHCCPTDARVFGDLDDPDSEISQLERSESAQRLLESKGTRPAVFYVS